MQPRYTLGQKVLQKEVGKKELRANVISARHGLQSGFNYHLPRPAVSLYVALVKLFEALGK